MTNLLNNAIKYSPAAKKIVVSSHLKSQERTRHIRLMMVSASPDIAILLQQAGADDNIEKPFDIRSLLDLIRSYIKSGNQALLVKSS
ncbi:MAG: hybrid sensor histidine kinase/response regulator [Chitinophagaceae bacterium]